jgi:hypothetical protein
MLGREVCLCFDEIKAQAYFSHFELASSTSPIHSLERERRGTFGLSIDVHFSFGRPVKMRKFFSIVKLTS